MTANSGCVLPVTSSDYTVSNVNATPSAVITAGASTVQQGTPTSLSIPTGAGNALAFASNGNGTNYITLPRSIITQFAAGFTYEAFIKVSATSGTNWLFTLGSTVGTAAVNGNYIGLAVEPGGNLSVYSDNSQANHTNFASSNTIVAGTVYHIALTMDGTNMNVYLNGNTTPIYTVACSLLPSTLNASANPFDFLGHPLYDDTTPGQPDFKGTMDEVRFWKAARTGTQIHAAYKSSVTTNSTGLVAYYKLDNATTSVSTTVTDATGNGYNATLSSNFVTNTPQPYVASPVTGFNSQTVVWSPSTGLNRADTGVVTATPLVTTTYTVTVTSSAGCVSSSSKTITVTPPPTFLGTVSTDWATAANWSSGVVPGATDSVIVKLTVARLPTISDARSVKSLYVAFGATVTVGTNGSLDVKQVLNNLGSINNNGSLTMSGTAAQVITGGGRVNSLTITNTAGVTLNSDLTVNGKLSITGSTLNVNNKTLTLNSGSYLTNVASGILTNASHTIAKQALDPARVNSSRGSWYYVAPLVTGQTMNAWSWNNNYDAGTFSADTSKRSSVYTYDPTYTTVRSRSGFVNPSSASVSAPSGSGAYVWFGGQFYAAGATQSQQGAPFLGTKDWTTLKYCTGSCANGSTTNGFNLIGNPYYASLDWDNAAWTKTNVSGTIWFWEGTEGRYGTYAFNSGGGTNGASNVIAKGQGFFIKVTAANPVLTVTPAALASSQSTILRTAATGKLRLKMASESYSDEILLTRNNTVSRAYNENKDSEKMFNSKLNLGWKTDGEVLAIANRPVEASDVIDLHLTNTLTSATTLAVSETEGFEDLNMYLLDRNTNTTVLLTAGTAVNVESDITGTRYALLFTESVTAVKAGQGLKLNLYPNPANDVMYVEGLNAEAAKALVLTDVLGHEVQLNLAPQGSRFALDLTGLAPGMYMLKANGKAYPVVKK